MKTKQHYSNKVKEIVQNDRSKFYIGITLMALCLIVIFFAIFGVNQDEAIEPIDTFTNTPPGSFIPQKATLTAPAEPRKAPLNIDDYFNKVRPAAKPVPTKADEVRSAFSSLRNDEQGLKKISISYSEGEGDPDYTISNVTKFQNMDIDYTRHNEPRTVTSFPVDLTRVLPITETIPVILLDEIKSELSGEVVRAKISQDVYGYHNRKILVPAGSTAIGRYKPLKKVGDTRIDIEFYRILTPEGINIQIIGFAADQEGSQGMTGEINNKNWERFGVAGIAAGIQAAAQLSVDVNDERAEGTANAITEPLSEVMTQVISESINIAPTVRIKKGASFFLKFQADIFFPPARDRQVVTQSVNSQPHQTARR